MGHQTPRAPSAMAPNSERSYRPLPASRLRGVIPPLVTPLSGRDTLDAEGLERLVEHVVAGGVSGVFILGTTGEGPSLGYALRRELVRSACRAVSGRVPVLVGITDTAYVESVRMAQHAAEVGAAALVLATPYYFPAGQSELVEYLGHLVPELPLPLLLYNMPSMTKTRFAPETVRRVMDLEGVVGIKDSSGDLAYLETMCRLASARDDWSVFIGPEEKLAEAVALGAHGGVCGGANLCPRLFVELHEAAVAGDEARVATLKRRAAELGRIYRVGRYASAIIKGLKCALSLAGICDDFMAEPFHRFRAPEREAIRRGLSALALDEVVISGQDGAERPDAGGAEGAKGTKGAEGEGC